MKNNTYEYFKKAYPPAVLRQLLTPPKQTNNFEETNQEEMLNALYGREQQLKKNKNKNKQINTRRLRIDSPNTRTRRHFDFGV